MNVFLLLKELKTGCYILIKHYFLFQKGAIFQVKSFVLLNFSSLFVLWGCCLGLQSNSQNNNIQDFSVKETRSNPVLKWNFLLKYENLLVVSEFHDYSSMPRLMRKLHAVTMDTMLTFIIFKNKYWKSQRSFATKASSGCSKTENSYLHWKEIGYFMQR